MATIRSPSRRASTATAPYSSPALAGGKLFITSPFGTTLILQPGREYKELARTRIDRYFQLHYKPHRHEETCANLFFDGPRIYYRSDLYLYCIEEGAALEPAVPGQ